MGVKEFGSIAYHYDLESDPAEKNAWSYQVMKRAFDFTCSLLATAVFGPLMIAVAVMIRLTSKGPAVYRQVRVGRDGRHFVIYKFRTMINGAEDLTRHLTPELIELYNRNRKILDDPRITRVGKFLRKTSVDELPQLLNILKGEMSVVGPRPMMPDEIELYGSAYNKYISVTPGLTGLWQILSRHKTGMDERAAMDTAYIENKSMVYDLRIVLNTVYAVFTKKGAC